MTTGRTANATEKAFHDLLCRHVGCAVCRFHHGRPNTYCSVHHIDGRTKPQAHWLVLPLCAGHHQEGTGNNPEFIPVHPWKRRFEVAYGTQLQLLAQCIRMLREEGHDVPDQAMRYAA